jgi:hypothetical protein
MRDFDRPEPGKDFHLSRPLRSMVHLPATFPDGSPVEVRIEIFQSEPIRPVVQPGMPDRLALANVAKGAIRDLEK